MTMEKVEAELNRAVQVPGLSNLFVPPIANRVEMQSTGIKSPIGIKVAGPDPVELQRLSATIARIAGAVPGVSSAATDNSAGGGRYVDVHIRPEAAARYGLTQADLQDLIATAVGGDAIGETVQGRERFPIVLRYPCADRQTLGAVADISVQAGPSMLTSEDGELVSYVYVTQA